MHLRTTRAKFSRLSMDFMRQASHAASMQYRFSVVAGKYSGFREYNRAQRTFQVTDSDGLLYFGWLGATFVRFLLLEIL